MAVFIERFAQKKNILAAAGSAINENFRNAIIEQVPNRQVLASTVNVILSQ